ncbi:hypothetical protein [Mycobacterium ahvazicum]|uniref:hypothetical protein n=1 Tax=Mycobacterium ahvazicum TaxID=1964395 RepID=UPI003C6DB247
MPNAAVDERMAASQSLRMSLSTYGITCPRTTCSAVDRSPAPAVTTAAAANHAERCAWLRSSIAIAAPTLESSRYHKLSRSDSHRCAAARTSVATMLAASQWRCKNATAASLPAPIQAATSPAT